MKKLTASLVLMTFFAAGTALASEPADTGSNGKSAVNKEKQMDRERADFRGRPDKKPRPHFEECDKDKDGALNMEEYLACYPRGGQQRFAAIDSNGDGKVTRDEMKAFRDTKRTERKREFFNACDKNKDGMLSFEEFEQCRPERGDKGAHGKKARFAPKLS